MKSSPLRGAGRPQAVSKVTGMKEWGLQKDRSDYWILKGAHAVLPHGAIK